MASLISITSIGGRVFASASTRYIAKSSFVLLCVARDLMKIEVRTQPTKIMDRDTSRPMCQNRTALPSVSGRHRMPWLRCPRIITWTKDGVIIRRWRVFQVIIICQCYPFIILHRAGQDFERLVLCKNAIEPDTDKLERRLEFLLRPHH